MSSKTELRSREAGYRSVGEAPTRTDLPSPHTYCAMRRDPMAHKIIGVRYAGALDTRLPTALRMKPAAVSVLHQTGHGDLEGITPKLSRVLCVSCNLSFRKRIGGELVFRTMQADVQQLRVVVCGCGCKTEEW